MGEFRINAHEGCWHALVMLCGSPRFSPGARMFSVSSPKFASRFQELIVIEPSAGCCGFKRDIGPTPKGCGHGNQSQRDGCGSKLNRMGLRRFWSMFPLTRVPFLYRFFEPQPDACSSLQISLVPPLL